MVTKQQLKADAKIGAFFSPALIKKITSTVSKDYLCAISKNSVGEENFQRLALNFQTFKLSLAINSLIV